MKKYCISQSIARLERLMAKGDKITWLLNDDDTIATHKEIREAIQQAKLKGYCVLPPCDNVTETGHCAGHDVPGSEEGK